MSIKKTHIELGLRLASLRKKAGKSQKEMAKSLDIATSTYQYYERGERDIPATVLKKITRFGVTLEWLIFGEETISSQNQQDFIQEENFVNNSKVVNYDSVIEAEHMQLIKQFRNKELAKDLNFDLLKLEKADPGCLREIKGYLSRMIDDLSYSSRNEDGNGGGDKEETKKKA